MDMTGGERELTHQIRQTVQFLSHQTALVPPPRDFPVHKIEEQPKRHERQRRPDISECLRGPETVSHRAENRHEAAETYGRRSGQVVGWVERISEWSMRGTKRGTRAYR